MAKLEGHSIGYSYHLPTGGWLLRLRNALSQFSDVFSEFDKYIAPAYHHDRCERSVPMRLYSMHKREFVMVFIAFFACFGLGVFIGLAGPPVTSTIELNGRSTLGNRSASRICCGPFHMRTPLMSPYHQQLWLIARINTDNSDDEVFDKSFQVSVNIDHLEGDFKHSVIGFKQNNRTRHLKCEKQLCEEFKVLHLGFIEAGHYNFEIRFYGLEEFHKIYNINRLTFYMRTYNPAFTEIEVWFRLIFLISSFFITCWFMYTLRVYPMYDWSIEQKWMSILLPLLLGYNNPVFPMSVLVNSSFPGMLDALAQLTFLGALLLFWLCIFHGLRQNGRSLLTFYLPKMLVVGALWIPATVLSSWQRYGEYQDPTYNHSLDSENFTVVKYILVSSALIYIAYLLYLVLHAYSDLRSMPYLDLRLKFLLVLTTVVTSTGVIIAHAHYGPDVLEDDFASELGTRHASSAHFMALYGMLNVYLAAMAYVYAPAHRALSDYGMTKDNPAFTMIHDSDEDVAFASEEESRKPLNQSRNDDDSD